MPIPDAARRNPMAVDGADSESRAARRTRVRHGRSAATNNHARLAPDDRLIPIAAIGGDSARRTRSPEPLVTVARVTRESASGARRIQVTDRAASIAGGRSTQAGRRGDWTHLVRKGRADAPSTSRYASARPSFVSAPLRAPMMAELEGRAEKAGLTISAATVQGRDRTTSAAKPGFSMEVDVPATPRVAVEWVAGAAADATVAVILAAG